MPSTHPQRQLHERSLRRQQDAALKLMAGSSSQASVAEAEAFWMTAARGLDWLSAPKRVSVIVLS